MSRDCCSWDGVVCDDMTGLVIELDLGCSGLVGTIDSNSSLFQLSHLQRLDLSLNNFSNSHISPEFGSSYKLSGYFPKTKWNNNTSLRKLELSGVNFSDNLPESLGYHLTSLYYFSLSHCKLWGPIPKSLSNLTSIEYLLLDGNSLNGIIPSGMFSLPSLIYLELSHNHFSGQLEDFKSNSLFYIGLSNNQLEGHLPKSIQNLVNLTTLDLSSNNFSGNVDVSLFSNLKQLSYLILSSNNFSGNVDVSLFSNLKQLSYLILSSNNFSGNVDVSLFSDLKQLSYLSLSHNHFSLTNENKVKVTLPGSLHTLQLAACEVKELEFLKSTNHLVFLDLSNNKLQGKIPDWAWSKWMFSLQYLDLSHNMLTSVDSIPLQSLDTIDLRSNLLQGSLPIPPNSTRLFLISQNNLRGEIPASICNLMSLQILDLARNNLHGEIPQCLGNMTALWALDMRHNNLSGNIPPTFSNESILSSLNLHGNNLEGKIPRSLVSCKDLQLLDLGNNNLNDTFPVWLGALPNLLILSLRSNKLHGPIRTSRSENMFPKLRIIDLSYNAFSGNLPSSLFQHLKAMRTIDPSMEAARYGGNAYYQDSIIIAIKGFEREIVRILYLYTVIDLSSNKFRGQIPSIMGHLNAVHILNLSHNGLQGDIPTLFGDLSSLESLDLSGNKLSGEIPQQLAFLTSLAFLNLSHNHLQGCIPRGPQFHTFENNSYEGNDGLRGFPISNGCGDARVFDTNDTVSGLDDEESNSEFQSDFWKGVLMGYGSGLCIGLSIIYFMISTGKPIWLARIIVGLEHKIMMGRRKKQRRQMNYRRRNNHSFQ
ncbi:hypothetical protein KY290_010418 [Solanum tuberosum]|uniref:Uncharacterized protein n=1 Tax=Solanum tuberosum TaxID=4113 RepID=A0ABQ7VYY1_SOLTU|nr:hypothetical protein KY284_010332 [Solanum tuberosum]KAH0773281.1 hypothetical protein KY290_010418 [Solanum tuberosum]